MSTLTANALIDGSVQAAQSGQAATDVPAAIWGQRTAAVRA